MDFSHPIFTDGKREIYANEFIEDVEKLSAKLGFSKRWALCYEDSYLFTVALFAVLYSSCQPILLPNNQPGTIKDFSKEFDDVLTDTTSIREQQGSLQHNLDKTQIITIFTSGSTGVPKKCTRTLQQLMHEIEALELTFGSKIKAKSVSATVSHQHIYGLLFYILWPLCTHRTINLDKTTATGILISSPASLTRMPDLVANKNLTIFSSGGKLPPHEHIIDIFGSTETSGVAFRQNGANNWTPLPSVKMGIDKDTQCLRVKSSFFGNNDYFTMGDKAIINADGTFQLLERTDRIVKIEGKRVSLVELENILKQHEFVADAYALPMESNRQYIAVVVTLTPKGKQHLHKKSKILLNTELKNALSLYFEPVSLPKRFRYVDNIPTNAQGKHVINEIKELFAKSTVRQAQLISCDKSPDNIILQLFIQEELIFFKGHFPVAPILPGIVQVDWAIGFAQQFFNIPKASFLHIEQLKFTKVIKPAYTLSLSLTIKNKLLQFKYFNEDIIYSMGKIKSNA